MKGKKAILIISTVVFLLGFYLIYHYDYSWDDFYNNLCAIVDSTLRVQILVTLGLFIAVLKSIQDYKDNNQHQDIPLFTFITNFFILGGVFTVLESSLRILKGASGELLEKATFLCTSDTLHLYSFLVTSLLMIVYCIFRYYKFLSQAVKFFWK